MLHCFYDKEYQILVLRSNCQYFSITYVFQPFIKLLISNEVCIPQAHSGPMGIEDAFVILLSKNQLITFTEHSLAYI